jgi:RimJ/RimL family protein N-acetyltransferase
LRRAPIVSVLNTPKVLTGKKINLRLKRPKDAANDYSWQKDAELCRLDAAAPLLCSFEEFLETYAEEFHRPSRSCRFAIETLDGKHIGNCSYFSVDEIKGEAELGIMIGDKDYWNQGYGTDVICTSLNHIFSRTNLNRIYLKTLEWNFRAQRCFQKCGFKICGHLSRGEHNFILMEIYRAFWLQEKRTEPLAHPG